MAETTIHTATRSSSFLWHTRQGLSQHKAAKSGVICVQRAVGNGRESNDECRGRVSRHEDDENWTSPLFRGASWVAGEGLHRGSMTGLR